MAKSPKFDHDLSLKYSYAIMNNSEIKLQFTSLVLRCVSVGNAALIMSEKDIGSVLVSSLKKHDTPFIQSLSELNEKIQ